MKNAIKNNHKKHDHKKFTVLLPSEIVENAVRMTGGSVRLAIETALTEMMHRRGSQALLSMRGKLDLDVNLAALRRDK